jgi:hypothetical protein
MEGTCLRYGGHERCAKIAVVKNVKKISPEGPRLR